MIAKISWKNIWRNKLRSGVVIAAIAIGIVAATFMGGMMNGMMEDMVKTLVNEDLGHGQVHHPNYLLNSEIEFLVDKDSVAQVLDAEPNVTISSSRLLLESVAQTAGANRGVQLKGVVPADEVALTHLDKNVIAGEYLSLEHKRGVLVGKKLAEKLKLEVGDKLILTLMLFDGGSVQERFKIAGIYQTANTSNDERFIFANQATLYAATGVPSHRVHEVAFRVADELTLSPTIATVGDELPNYTVRDWKAIQPAISMSAETMDTYLFVILAIVLLALLFGIVNTMLMAILERRRELAMLRACGMNKQKISAMIMLETVFMSMIGGVIGVILGYGIVTYLSKNGLKMGEAYDQFGVSNVVYFKIDPLYFLYFSVMVFFTALIASIFPTRSALGMKISKALNAK